MSFSGLWTRSADGDSEVGESYGFGVVENAVEGFAEFENVGSGERERMFVWLVDGSRGVVDVGRRRLFDVGSEDVSDRVSSDKIG